jgi:hypothetical protein
MIQAIRRFVLKLRSRHLCKCEGSFYEVIDKKLYCRVCRKPASKLRVQEGGMNV